MARLTQSQKRVVEQIHRMTSTKIVKSRQNSIPHLNFGLSIIVKGKRTTMTGICPSPAYANELQLIKAVLAEINSKLGTRYKLMESK